MPETTTPAKISTGQMRRMHALLREHGMTTDKAVHAYLTRWTEENEQDPFTSREDITTTQAAAIIADLEAADVAHTATTAALARLRDPFPEAAIGKLPRSTCRACSDSPRKRCDQHTWVSRCPVCNGSHSSATMHIDYVGHADVTDRLLSVDPTWTWEPAMRDPNGHPSIAASMDRDGNLWINLTILGVTRPAVGDGKNAKERIGDALRNGAMRAGVALDLWAKGDRDWAREEKHGTDQHPDENPGNAPQADPPPTPWHGPTTEELLAMVDEHANAMGVTYEHATAKWREYNGGLSVDDLDHLPPQTVAGLEGWLAEHRRKTTTASGGDYLPNTDHTETVQA